MPLLIPCSQGEVSQDLAVFALADSSYVVAGQTGLQSNINNSYTFKTNSSGNIYESVLSGQVYHDRDSSCSFNSNDLPFANPTKIVQLLF